MSSSCIRSTASSRPRQGISSIVGGVIVVLIVLLSVTLIWKVASSYVELEKRVGESMISRIRATQSASSLRSYWYEDSSHLYINVTNTLLQPVTITGFVAIFQNSAIFASPSNTSLENVKLVVTEPSGKQVYYSGFPVVLCPRCTLTITVSLSGSEGKVMGVSLASEELVNGVPSCIKVRVESLAKYLYGWILRNGVLTPAPGVNTISIGSTTNLVVNGSTYLFGSLYLGNLSEYSVAPNQSVWLLMIDNEGRVYKVNSSYLGRIINATIIVRDNDWFWNGNYLYSNPNATAIGIGTETPRAKLEVVGNVMVTNPSNPSSYVTTYFGTYNDIAFNGSALVIHPAWSNGYNPSGLVYLSDNPNYVKVGIGTDRPQYRLDVNGNIRAISASVYADYFRLTESGSYTGWFIDYHPENYMSIEWENVSNTQEHFILMTFDHNRWVNVSGWLKVQPPGTSLTSYPSGWGMGLWTWDVYAEGSVGLGRNGQLVVWISGTGEGRGFVELHDVNTGSWARILMWGNDLQIASGSEIDMLIGGYGSNGQSVVTINSSGVYVWKTIYVNEIKAINVYADYYHITESGKDTGWYFDYFPDNGRVSIVKNGLGEVMSWLPSGNVGIGTVNPQYKLDVNGAIRANASTVYADYFEFTEGGSPTNFVLDYLPNGINNANAIGVVVNGIPKMYVDENGYIYTPRLYITDEGSESTPYWHLDRFPDNGRLAIVSDTKGIEVLDLLPNGSVGIGTPNPSAKLEVRGDLKVSNPSDTSRYFRLYFGALNDLEFNGSAMVIHPAWGSSGYNPNGVVYISNNPNYVEVGIGTDHPQYRLDVAGDIRAIAATVHADHFRFTEGGNDTPFQLDYFPSTINGRDAIGVSYNGKGVMFVDYQGYVYAPRYYITEEGSETTPYWHIDFFPGTPNHVSFISDTNDHEVLQIWSNDSVFVRYSVYADYFKFTEGGSYTGFDLDYFPNGINNANAIGVAVNGVAKVYVDENGYVYAPRFYITEEGQYTSPKWYIDYNPSGDRLDIIPTSTGKPVVQLYPATVNIYGDLDLEGNNILGINNIYIIGGSDGIGVIYGPNTDLGSQIVFDGYDLELKAYGEVVLEDDGGGIYFRGLTENDYAYYFLVIDSSGRVYYRDISNYLRVNTLEATSVKIDSVSSLQPTYIVAADSQQYTYLYSYSSLVNDISSRAVQQALSLSAMLSPNTTHTVYDLAGYTSYSQTVSGPAYVYIMLGQIGRYYDGDTATISVYFSNGVSKSITVYEGEIATIYVPSGLTATISISTQYPIGWGQMVVVAPS